MGPVSHLVVLLVCTGNTPHCPALLLGLPFFRFYISGPGLGALVLPHPSSPWLLTTQTPKMDQKATTRETLMQTFCLVSNRPPFFPPLAESSSCLVTQWHPNQLRPSQILECCQLQAPICLHINPHAMTYLVFITTWYYLHMKHTRQSLIEIMTLTQSTK